MKSRISRRLYSAAVFLLMTIAVVHTSAKADNAAGATPYQRDLEDSEVHLIGTVHFALETHGQEIADRLVIHHSAASIGSASV